jgi:outer membrane protein OmpA-like peptidoglycan-associated protein
MFVRMHHGERRASRGALASIVVHTPLVGELTARLPRPGVRIHSIGMHTMPRISALILGLSLTVGCSKSSPDTAVPDGPDEDITTAETAEVAPLRVTGLYIDPALMAVCELDEREDVVTFDRDAESPHVDAMLSAVAECVKTGPLQGRRIELVGHAARRDAYFQRFGTTRADAIRGVLVRDGLKADDIVTHALGPEDDFDAAAEWPSERRVDLRVATRHAK